MPNFVSYDKLSKKKKREVNAKKRGTWNGFNPVTRKPENFRAYNRNKKKAQDKKDFYSVSFGLYIYN